MTTLTAVDIHRRSGSVRKALLAGHEVEVTFHSNTIGHLVPRDKRHDELAELEKLRAEVEELRAQLAELADEEDAA